MALTKVGDSVEGEKLSVQCRKFVPRPPDRDPKHGIVYRFKLNIYGEVAVLEELNPKAAIWREESALNESDEIRGETIDGRALKPVKLPEVGAATGTHSASYTTARGKAFAKIEIGLRHILQAKQLGDKS